MQQIYTNYSCDGLLCSNLFQYHNKYKNNVHILSEFYYADILTYIFGLCWSYSFLQNLENKIRASVDEVVKKAKSEKEIGLEELVTDIYAESKEPIIRGATPWDRYQHKTLGTAVNV